MADPLDYQRSGPSERSDRDSSFSWVRVLITAGIVLLVLIALSASLTSSAIEREDSGQVKCASNLRQIGQAIALYCTEGDGHYPPDFSAVLRSTQLLSSEVFDCPSSEDTKASSPAQLSQPGHCSYIYVGSSLSWSKAAAGDQVVAFEDPANHKMKGGNVLYEDGHMEWVFMPNLMTMINDLAAGRNPPKSKTTMTQAAAEQDYKKNWQSRMPAMKTSGWRIPTTQPTK